MLVQNLLKTSELPGSNLIDFWYPDAISESEAMKLQQEAGMSPAGYGFYSYKAGDSWTSWKCADTCD